MAISHDFVPFVFCQPNRYRLFTDASKFQRYTTSFMNVYSPNKGSDSNAIDRQTDRHTNSVYKVQIQNYNTTKFTNVSKAYDQVYLIYPQTTPSAYTNIITVVPSPHLHIPQSRFSLDFWTRKAGPKKPL